MVWLTQPYGLANATVLSGSFYAVEDIILRRRKHRSTPWNIPFYGGKTIRLPPPFGHSSGEQLYRRSREAEQEAREAATRYKLYMLSAVVAVLFVTLMIFLLYSMRLKAFNKRLMEKDRLLRTTNVAESIECRIKCVSLWRNIVI